jgi:hydrogenase expression/formation protein HypC
MCLGDIAQVVALDDKRGATVRVGERLVSVSLMTLDEPVAVGEWLVVHSGLALELLSEESRRDAQQIRATTQEELS